MFVKNSFSSSDFAVDETEQLESDGLGEVFFKSDEEVDKSRLALLLVFR